MKKQTILFTGDQMNLLLSEIREICWMDNFHLIEQKDIDDLKERIERSKKMYPDSYEEEIEFFEIFKQLVGFEVQIDQNGDHKNDGQIVDYTFTFKSPSSMTTTFETGMSLMTGWNIWDSFEIIVSESQEVMDALKKKKQEARQKKINANNGKWEKFFEEVEPTYEALTAKLKEYEFPEKH